MPFSSTKLRVKLPGTDEVIEARADELIVDGVCVAISSAQASCVDEFTLLLGFHGNCFLPAVFPENLALLRTELESRLAQVDALEADAS
jgi:hypothetical protein